MASTTITKFAHLQIPLEDVIKATNNFHPNKIISQGGFGPAYKGQLLRSGKLIKIAARRLDRKRGLGDSEFWTEVSVLSELKHTNLVSIIGFCDEKDEKIIITTYEANGSLEQFLNSPNLTWTQRLRICIGVARALSYLHSYEGRGYAVIHRFINNSTILLDENREAKLSGFEISIKQSVHQKDQVFLCEPIGIREYMDPEIDKTRGVTCKSDIYSFGVVLFELLCGRRASIKKKAKYHYENKRLKDIIHPDLYNEMSPYSLIRYSNAAYSCLNKERAQRPDTSYVVAELEKALELQLRLEYLGKKLNHLKIPLTDIKLATDNFSKAYIIESWSYPTFYRAELYVLDRENTSSKEGKNKGEHPKGQNIVVIKRYPSGEDELYGEEQFFIEIEMLASVKHRNIVSLLGFCIEDSEMIVVTENVSNGYLGDYLGNVNDKRILTWERRLKICIDVARVLNYLHSEMEDQKTIINSDICSQRIGLDENFGAKVVDFGLSAFLPPIQENEALYRQRFVFSELSYLDPIYNSTGMLKRESDVYSFGVVLFEVLCGRLAFDPIYKKKSDLGLAHLARQSFGNRTLEDMIDPIIKEEATKDSLHTFIKIAHQCVAETQDERPTMKVVIKELEKALLFQENDKDSLRMSLEEIKLATQSFHEDNCIGGRSLKEERVLRPNMDPKVHQVIDRPHKTLENLGNNLEHLKIPLRDIQSATNNFKEYYRIADWNYSTLYRAQLNHFDKENPSSSVQHAKRRNMVVIKRISPGHELNKEEHFFTEIEMLSIVKHPNIVTLRGFCVEGSEKILVTENISNGYLAHYMGNYNNMLRTLTWERRLKICIDVAHALKYLHFEMEDQKTIINFEISSRNIGLDENFQAKIVDFYCSAFLSPNQEALYPNMFGTLFYTDPEYLKSHKLKRESDVYSFGVVLFEILCGKLAKEPIYLKESKEGLGPVARRRFCTGSLDDMIDPILKEETCENSFVLNRGPTKDSLRTFIEIAYRCLAETQDQRPTMKVVIKELEKALFLQKNNKENPRISLEDIKLATNNFHDENYIGEGGFGRVHIGTLQDGDGHKTIVTKRLDKRSDQGEKEFLTELQILLEYKHENVIGLVGYCDENDEKILVYEYASRGNLQRYLNNASLTWVKRLDICIDVASALYFLHGGGAGKQAKVIHRDIKTANILLNDDWKAKLADFGLSLISPLVQETDYVIDHACGTLGYLDPLYHKSGFLTIESDIYSFGVVLFEMLYGRSTFAIKKHEGHHLPDFIKNIFEEGKLDEMVFEQIREQIMPKSLTTFQKIAYQCLHHEREKRPTTKKVLIQLKKALEFQNMTSTMTKFSPLQIPLEDVLKATNNFHHDNFIGHAGFGSIYKGQLLMRSGREMKIFARRFDRKHWEVDLEFLTEISMLYDLNHTNIVSIIGFCDEKEEKIIITKYEANESLGQYLNSSNLTWTQRLRICVGVARALSYLHYDEGRDYAIIHCNINSDTILFDENSEAKLSRFEYSIRKFYDQDCLYDHVGVMGYIDESIEKTGRVTHKSDTYSFGVVLLEILCGRKGFIQNEVDEFLAPLAKYHYENKTLNHIIHPNVYWNIFSPKSLLKYSNVAYSCLNEDPTLRPDMDYIVEELEKALEHQLQFETYGKNLEHLKIPLSHIRLATNNFSQKYNVASWPRYTLYRAEIDHYDNESHSSVEGKNNGEHPKRRSAVIIKRYHCGHKQFKEEQFLIETEILTGAKHPNIVTLLGYCVEGSEMILVTENLSNGFLGDYLVNINGLVSILTWEKRLKICIDVAHALSYLHSEMEGQKIIINRDISSYNIGFDEDWMAKIVDFGLSVILPPNQEEEALYLDWIGKLSYTDPEYMTTGKLKRESDVYSFGVVLFEILCGRLASASIYHMESDKGLVPMVRQSFDKGTLEEMIDPIIKEETSENPFVLNRGPNKDSLHTFIKIAYQCLAETQDQRPTMKAVVKELEKALSFQVNNKDNPRIPPEDIKVGSNYVGEKSHDSIIETMTGIWRFRDS